MAIKSALAVREKKLNKGSYRRGGREKVSAALGYFRMNL